ncbi:hypothetical protein [Dermatophilus congolensis]|uniref:hypothetical protein n=1 Tax=Dermatophilus congolensis TaxID=1863 RepID=UPI001AAF7F65|nr:hypothetical protein [Dermatophilus congolensis]MBO3142952.1 hypothetical protein [Dermatophilus congolensis]MBO3151942.1 hypothetical protein [Dermatophilus congolensis]MBO3161051.1 hypothetical protein [Dermatophilus congolensis]MBO3163225.1 hypothetical protein [Dermatophilus congolensis]MBO3176782.1 hypothetical protein [Dermatophilus congolensis]
MSPPTIERPPCPKGKRNNKPQQNPTHPAANTAAAEILNLMQETENKQAPPYPKTDNTQYLHRFADRNRWVADAPGAPVNKLISPAYATERACGFNPDKAA